MTVKNHLTKYICPYRHTYVQIHLCGTHSELMCGNCGVLFNELLNFSSKPIEAVHTQHRWSMPMWMVVKCFAALMAASTTTHTYICTYLVCTCILAGVGCRSLWACSAVIFAMCICATYLVFEFSYFMDMCVFVVRFASDLQNKFNCHRATRGSPITRLSVDVANANK